VALVAIREILKYPNRKLKLTCEPVREINGKLAGRLNDMVETMYASDGIGLAAPQLGLLERTIVVDTNTANRGVDLVKLINPEIIEAEGKIVWEEGCLSVVNYQAEVTRSQRILVRGWTIDQKQIEIEAEDLPAVCLQHEIDHLDGVLFIDQISRLKRELYRKRVKKLVRDEPELFSGPEVPAL
jgi:peptide deformylase